MKKEMQELAKESRALEGIEGAVPLAGEKVAEAGRLREQARQLQERAQLEDLTVRGARWTRSKVWYCRWL
jgi:hypothetical protein